MPRQDLIPLRRGTKASWESANPTLAEGEPGFETDTYTLKVGDGNTPYTTLPALNMGIQYYNAQVNGFEISKDNDDVERKVFVDDFSVNSKENYEGDVDAFTWDTANKKVYSDGISQFTISHSINGFMCSVYLNITDYPATGNELQFVFGNGHLALYSDGSSTTYARVYNAGTASVVMQNKWSVNTPFIVNILDTGDVYVNGTLSNISIDTSLASGIQIRTSSANYPSVEIYNILVLPSISYTDSFSADTVTSRYAPVAGTLAYDDANDRMSMTAPATSSAKARLKSYKHVSGNYKVKMTLPATATDGDACIHYLATQGDCSTGYGAGVIRTAGIWNIATANGTTITDTGTPVTNLADGDSFYVELLRDVEHGVTWYYVYESAKPTEASGKLFNVYQEGYSAYWYKNTGASPVIAYVDDIEIRAESIVGRTNVPVEEDFWFRDEFSENSIGRLSDPTISGVTISSGVATITTSSPLLWPLTTLHDCGESCWKIDITNNNSIAESCKIRLHPYHQTNNTYYDFRIYASTSSSIPNTLRLYSVINGVETQIDTDAGITFTTGTLYHIIITRTTDGIFSFYMDDVDGTTLVKTFQPDTSLTWGSFLMYGAGTTDNVNTVIDNLQISGTRVYDKPIHRGAQIGEYEE